MKTLSRLFVTVLFVCAFAPVALASDTITVGSATAQGTSATVPVYVSDQAGTPLGVDQAAGSKIQSFSMKVTYSPASAVSSVTFSRAGITANLTPIFESSPQSPGTASLLATFSESSNPIPFTLNASSPGDQVANLVFTLGSSATPGTTISLTLDPSTTQLVNEGGTAKETFALGTLGLVNGTITVPQLTLSLTPPSQSVDLNASVQLRVNLSSAVSSSTSVTLSSSDASVASVPASVVVASGSSSATFPVSGAKLGDATITATVASSSTTAAINVTGPGLTFNPFSRTLQPNASSTMSVVLTTSQASDVTVALSSSDAAVASAPASIVIPAGQTSATFQVTGGHTGTATLQGRLPENIGGRVSSSVITVSAQCVAPAVPHVSAPSDAVSAAPYTISWAAIDGATDYVVDESTDAAFSSPVTQTVTSTIVTFTHTVATNTTLYYRVRARNRGGACDVSSAASTSVSVAVRSSAEPAMRILAVVGSTPGSFGSFFKTSVQLTNRHSSAISGKIVFHRQGTSGSTADPFFSYSLQPGKTLSIADLLPAMAQPSGVGSADLIADAGSALPLSVVRIFNDGGAAGTSGMTEEAINPANALQAGDVGALVVPSDASKFRFNIGVRTLSAGASVTITVQDRDGIVLKTLDKSYPGTYFIQSGASDVLGGLTLNGDETLLFRINSGSALIYGTTNDNTTNDPSLQFARSGE